MLRAIDEVKGNTTVRLTRSALVATVSAAALLVVGFDYTTYAVTGDSLLLGRANHADRVTLLARHGSGPALSLQSRGQKTPSLRVSSSARVRHLDADLLDGKHASDLATRAVSYRAGMRGDVVNGSGFWRVKVTPGVYQVSFKAFVVPDAVAPGSSVDVICGVADLGTLGANTNVYTADSATYDNQFPTLMSGADTVRIKKSADPGIVCTTATGTNLTLFKPITASFTHVNHRAVRAATPVPTQRTGPTRLFADLHP
jgi:hypothetical protein